MDFPGNGVQEWVSVRLKIELSWYEVSLSSRRREERGRWNGLSDLSALFLFDLSPSTSKLSISRNSPNQRNPSFWALVLYVYRFSHSIMRIFPQSSRENETLLDSSVKRIDIVLFLYTHCWLTCSPSTQPDCLDSTTRTLVCLSQYMSTHYMSTVWTEISRGNSEHLLQNLREARYRNPQSQARV